MPAVRAAALALLACLWSAALTAPGAAQDRAGDFDFYVLSLSWSPAYCGHDPQAAGSRQCAAGRELGFVVHGLWPQYERGYPLRCDEGPSRVSRRIVAGILDLIPEASLVQHEWRQHGTCSGLSPEDYFALTRAAASRVRIPAVFADPQSVGRVSAIEAEAAFVAANPGMTRSGVAVACDGGRLEEIRVCLTRELDYRACEEVDRRGCRQRGLDMSSD